MDRQKLKQFSRILFLTLFGFNSISWAELKWIPETERVKFNLSGDLKTVNGKKVSLRDLKSKVIFLNFWATWCTPCRKEMPSMGHLYAELRTGGLEMIAVTSERNAVVQKYLGDKSFDFIVAVDPQDRLGTRFKTDIVPTTIVIDAQGRIALRQRGEFEWDLPEVVAAFRELLPGKLP